MVEHAGNSDQSPGAVDALPQVVTAAAATVWRATGVSSGARAVPEETAVALVCDGSTEAVMMATPADLEDFAVGFCLSEGIVRHPAEIRNLEIVAQPDGIEARIWLVAERGREAASRRRTRAGPTGCGLCGVDSLAEAARLRMPAPLPQLVPLAPEQLLAAMAALEAAQLLGPRTRAVHAAGFWRADDGLVAAREDVGRHNALDKLAGALARVGDTNRAGAVLLTSRVSVEMVQKTAALGAPVLVAVSAPTALAVRTAERAGITLVAVARRDGFEVFTHPHRIGL
jgi:FdhD protein